MKEREDSDRSGLKKKLVNAVALGAVALGVASLYHGKVDPYATEGDANSYIAVNDADLVITYDEWKDNDRLKEQANAIINNPERAYDMMKKESNVDDIYDLLVTAVRDGYAEGIGAVLDFRQGVPADFDVSLKKTIGKYDVALLRPQDIKNHDVDRGRLIVLAYDISNSIVDDMRDFDLKLNIF
jgi:hypothetical protein